MRLISVNTIGGNGFIMLLAVSLLTTLPASGQAGGRYDLTWSTIDGGGGTSAGGDYVLTGTIGQPDAAYSAGGSYELLGGFWTGGPLCFVDFYSFAKFAEQWLDEDCTELNNWCGGADFEPDGNVDFADLKRFVEEWLYSCPYNWQLK